MKSNMKRLKILSWAPVLTFAALSMYFATGASLKSLRVWSNFPVGDVPRPCLTLGSLSTAQRDAAMHMMQVLLSPKGYQ
jgi:hypothetical protein